MFENFRDKCIEIFELDPVYFMSAPGLAWQTYLKKTEVKLELITDYDMLLIVQKGIRGGICEATHRYVKANNKYMKNYDKNNESSYLKYLDANNLYGWAMSQKLLKNGFKVDVEYPKTLLNSHKDLPFLPQRKKVEKVEKLICRIEDK